MQEFNDQEYLQELQRPPSKSNDNPNTKNTNTQGFVVRNAPWHSAAPDTASTEEFPSFGSVVQPKSGHAWGPVRKNWSCPLVLFYLSGVHLELLERGQAVSLFFPTLFLLGSSFFLFSSSFFFFSFHLFVDRAFSFYQGICCHCQFVDSSFVQFFFFFSVPD